MQSFTKCFLMWSINLHLPEWHFDLAGPGNHMLIIHLWLEHKERAGCDIYSHKLLTVAVFPSFPHFHSTDFQSDFHPPPLTKHLKFQKLTLFCVTSMLSRSVRMHMWAGIPSGEHVHPNLAQISWWNPTQPPRPREFLSEIFAFLF